MKACTPQFPSRTVPSSTRRLVAASCLLIPGGQLVSGSSVLRAAWPTVIGQSPGLRTDLHAMGLSHLSVAHTIISNSHENQTHGQGAQWQQWPRGELHSASHVTEAPATHCSYGLWNTVHSLDTLPCKTANSTVCFLDLCQLQPKTCVSQAKSPWLCA